MYGVLQYVGAAKENLKSEIESIEYAAVLRYMIIV
jgi:hypothetical protein